MIQFVISAGSMTQNITVKFLVPHKFRHPRCVYNKIDWSVYTCLTQLYGGRDMYRIY